MSLGGKDTDSHIATFQSLHADKFSKEASGKDSFLAQPFLPNGSKSLADRKWLF